MNIMFVLSIAAFLSIGLTTSTLAAPQPKLPNGYAYAGITNAAVLPDGFNSMHAACQAEFGSAARMCTTKEIFESAQSSSITIPSSASQPWVEPVISAMISDGTKIYYSIIGGHVLPDGLPLPNITGLNCYSWSNPSSSGETGTVIGGSPGGVERFSTAACDTARPVACCLPQ
jgi:hypothetical protein